jgi:Sulfite exporter TauE/SafE
MISQHSAHGTSLFAVAATGIAGAIGYSNNSPSGTKKMKNDDDDTGDDDDVGADVVHYEAATVLALCGMVTARIGANATSWFSQTALKRCLGIFMLMVAPLIPAKQYYLNRYPPKESTAVTNTTTGNGGEDDTRTTTRRNSGSSSSKDGDSTTTTTTTTTSSPHYYDWAKRFLIPAAIGTCSGFLAGMFGVGGGKGFDDDDDDDGIVPTITAAPHTPVPGNAFCDAPSSICARS